MSTSAFVVLISALALAVIALQLLGSAGFSYDLQPDGLHLRAGGVFPKRIVPYDFIVEARRATFPEFLIARRYGFTSRNAVLLRLNTGPWRMLVVTPSDPDTFLRDLRARLHPRIAL